MSVLTQIAIVFCICLGGEAVAAALPFTFPASVAAMIILFLLLATNILHTRKIAQISEFLQNNMAFFFIPAGVNIMADVDALKGNIIPFLAVCVITTVITFAATAFAVSLVMRLQARHTNGEEA